jgi:hypothetical protein
LYNDFSLVVSEEELLLAGNRIISFALEFQPSLLDSIAYGPLTVLDSATDRLMGMQVVDSSDAEDTSLDVTREETAVDVEMH